MTRTAVGAPPVGTSMCWCCGAELPQERMVELGAHPEVTLCPRCARWAARRAGEVEDRDRSGPAVALRAVLRRLREGVVRRGWQQSRWIGGVLRRLGRRLP